MLACLRIVFALGRVNLDVASEQARVQLDPNGMDAHFERLRDLRLDGSAQRFEVPLGAVVSFTQCCEHRIEALVVAQPSLLPNAACRPVQSADPFDLGPAQPRLQGLGDHREQGVHRVTHLRDQSVAQAETTLPQQRLETPLRDVGDAGFLFEQALGVEDGACLVDEAQSTAQIIFTQVREEHVRFVVPRLEQAIDPIESLVARLLVQRLQDM